MLILKNTNIVDVHNSTIIFNKDILIKNESIAEIGNQIDFENAEVHDCTNKYVIPGYFESHSHLSILKTQDIDDKNWVMERFNFQGSFDAFVNEVLSDFFNKGITQIRDVGGSIKLLKQLLESPNIKPDIFYAGPMIEKRPRRKEDHNKTLPEFTISVDSEEELSKINEIKQQGATHLKTFGKFDKDQYKRFVQKASELNLPVTHDPGLPFFNDITMDFAIDNGVKCIEHGKSPLPCVLIDDIQNEHDLLYKRILKTRNSKPDESLKDETLDGDVEQFFNKVLVIMKESAISEEKLISLCEKMRRKKAYICPTLTTFNQMASMEKKDSPHIEGMKGLGIVNNYLTQIMIKQKVPVLVGQDSCASNDFHEEINCLHELGLSLPEIIKGLTIYPATWLQVDNRYGSVEKGKITNICILNSDPFDKVENLIDIDSVYFHGIKHKLL